MQIKVHKGDTVKVLSGKDRGKAGVVERVFPKLRRVVVTGINLVKKHRSPRRRAGVGGILTVPAALPIARVMVVCPHCQKPTRIAIQIHDDGTRARVCKQCQEMIGTKEK